MRKAQLLSVFLSLIAIISTTAVPVSVSAATPNELLNPFPKILQQFAILKNTSGDPAFAAKRQTDNELPLHTVYEVKSSSDSFMTIAQLYRISVSDIAKANPWIVGDLKIGQVIYIPTTAERIHHVFWGDTLYSIAARYGVSTQSLLEANPQISEGQTLQVNQEIRIPKQAGKNKQIVKVSNIPTAHNAMAWPVTGSITSPFGPRWGRFHQGIDIWNEQEYRTPVRAALSGTVAFAGWSGSGYGRLVILDHGNGIQTYYAHLSRINVSEGNKVRQGDILGYMGSSGDSLGIHLHFEVRVDDRPVNPSLYLPLKPDIAQSRKLLQ